MKNKEVLNNLSVADIDRIIQMAWEDRTAFEHIEAQFGLKEKDVRVVMRKCMKRSSFEMWRKRVASRKTKHLKLRNFEFGRFRSANQKNIF